MDDSCLQREKATGEQQTDPGKEVLDRIVSMVYDELRQIARFHHQAEPFDFTMQTTALVHEAYIKLANADMVQEPEDERHLKALTSRVIRHVLVDFARRRNAAKRDAGRADKEFLVDDLIDRNLQVDILDLDAALHKLYRRSERLGQLVEYRFFGGMSVDETADVMGLSKRTVVRDWDRAKTYLLFSLDDSP